MSVTTTFSFTVKLKFFFFRPQDTVILHLPFPIANTLPMSLTFATLLSLEEYFIWGSVALVGMIVILSI